MKQRRRQLERRPGGVPRSGLERGWAAAGASV